MALLASSRGWAEEQVSGDQARVLLVNKDPKDLFHYRAILQDLGCQVRASSCFAEGVECLGHGPFDLILLDQGSGRFEGQELLAQAMEVDVELRVLVLARSYDRNCTCKQCNREPWIILRDLWARRRSLLSSRPLYRAEMACAGPR